MLDIQNLSVSVKSNVILNNVNYRFKEGEIYGILGPNGAGKTTLFKSILKVIDYSGKISYNSENIGHLIDYPAFYSNLTCNENLSLHAKYIGVNQLDIDNLLSTVNLLDAKHKKFKNLSMGMKQRLGIAKTLIGDSDIIILDEPSNGLDPMGIKDIRDIMLNVVKSDKRVTLVSSHILKELSEFTDVFLFIRDGKLISHIKNSGNAYSIVKTEENYDDIKFTSSNAYSIIKSDGELYILSNYEDLKVYYKDVEEMNLEELYMKVMSMNIEEVYLK
ncbi:ATP-binding cassette domain-containing protein [Staphylococcus auricularis]|uniref:ATP-binding cassette domain-containing protein n=1 Tax=Staphylococcus auricularis TaxID=29379 RepID=UPI002432BC51|nr:ATP-binding cassette domain-containing protein [Staphylococcus auricularis]